ncbi:hypothetical protein AaE_012990 [Aphanomyces astaci]|uniref:Nucleolar pre-ribosomal-associated protein 1 C-terminal domain-containing protein n=1 Tax=Aphanomyces astaci TaxID=112090 RepID=A0A6A4ZN78_APHAT|nr:hypothetical protein AaE_012990 [Aphanomyces astaci]
MGRFGLYMLAIVDSTQQDTFKAIFRVSIGVLTRLPPAELESEHMASWLTSVVAFFTSTTNPVWFGQLPWSTQLEAVALLHHLPTYPPVFLRTLAACCKAEIVSVDAKSFVLDIVSDQLHKLDRGALLNFYMSTLFAQGNELLCPQVCRLLSGLNFGSSLSSILAPTLAKQSVEGNAVALVMAFVVCLKSNAKGSGGEKQRTPDVLKTHLVASFVKVLVTPQLEAAYSTLVYEGMQYCNGVFLDVATQLVAETNLAGLLQLLRESSLRKVVASYHAELVDVIAGIPTTHADDKRLLVNELKLVVVNA